MAEESLRYKTKKGLYWKFFDQFMNYGMQFIVGIFMAVAGVFISGGFGSALIRKENLTEEDLSTAFYYSVIVGVVCYVTLFFLSPYIADFYNTPVLRSLIRVTALGFLWGPLGTPQSVILNRRLDFKNPARISVVNKVIGSIVGISMAYMGYGLWALVFSGLVSSLIGLIPNCAASVILTNLYIQNIISGASLIAGLLTGAGVGLIILFKTNKNIKENIAIVGLLYAIGVFSGIVLQFIGIV